MKSHRKSHRKSQPKSRYKHNNRKKTHQIKPQRKNRWSRLFRQNGGHTITVVASSAGEAENKMNAAVSAYQSKAMDSAFK